MHGIQAPPLFGASDQEHKGPHAKPHNESPDNKSLDNKNQKKNEETKNVAPQGESHPLLAEIFKHRRDGKRWSKGLVVKVNCTALKATGLLSCL